MRRGVPATDPRSGTERLIVLAETRLRDPAALAELRRAVTSVTVDVLGTPPDDVILAPPGCVLKDGKIRRAASRARYESGAEVGAVAPAWWQVARFAWAGALPQLRRWARPASAAVFAGYAWALLAVLAPPVWVAGVTLPRTSWRWWVLRGAGRVLRRMTRTPLSVVVGTERFARIGPCVIVANHVSYLDGLALMLSLPRPVTVIAAADFRPRPIVGTLLRRLGCEFRRAATA